MAAKLIEVFNNCKCVGEEQHLAAGEVRSLAFGDNRSVMVIELGLHEVVKRDTLAKAEKQLANAYGLDRVCIEPRYELPGELPGEYIRSLYDDMAARMPSARGLLHAENWEYADGALHIPMDTICEKHFETALRHLEARIRRETSEGLAYQRPKTEKVREDDLVFGKLIQDPIVSVNEAVSAYDMVTIQGEVFFTEHKDIHSKKTGKDYVKIAFDITDRTNSVRVSKFLAADKAGDTASLIKKGLYCTVQGKMVFDTYTREMVLEPTGIVKAKKPERKDTYDGMKRVELHLHTNMSAMDGMSRLLVGSSSNRFDGRRAQMLA